MGLKIFSLDPTSIPDVKRKNLEADVQRLPYETEKIISCGDSNAIKDMVVALEKL